MNTRLTLCLAALISTISMGAQAAGDPLAGKAIAEKICVSCHGVEGKSSSPMYPHLAGQHASYLAYALQGYQSGERSNAIMQGFAAGLSEQDIENVSSWYASQSGLFTPEPIKPAH